MKREEMKRNQMKWNETKKNETKKENFVILDISNIKIKNIMSINFN
jgi:hypothetical protein